MRAIKLIKNGEEHYIDSFSQENVNSMIERYTRNNPEVKFFSMPRSAEQLYVGDSLEEIWNSYSNKNVVILREHDDDEGWFYDNLRYVTGIGGYDEYIMAEHDGVIKKFYLRGEGNNYYECVRIETEDARKVKFFQMPQVGDDLTEIINAATGEYLPVLIDSWEDNESAIAGTNKYIVEDCIVYSVASGSCLVATRGSSRTYFYFDSNNICTSIEEEGAHSELITTVTQDPNDGTMVVCSTGYGLSDGTVIHLTCGGFYDNVLQKVSFNSGLTSYPLISPSGNADYRYGTLQKQFDMTAQVMGGGEAYFELTGMILNGKVYVWDFYKREYRENNE